VPVVACQGNEFREVWYHFISRGSIQSGDFVAIDPDFSGTGGAGKSCPNTGIRYLPKEDGPAKKPTGTYTSNLPSGTSTPKGKGQLVVRLAGGNVLGCLIGNGKWYNTIPGSSCASFTSQDNGMFPSPLPFLVTSPG
jgi:ribonuclease T2